jgi:hypothetical protein
LFFLSGFKPKSVSFKFQLVLQYQVGPKPFLHLFNLHAGFDCGRNRFLFCAIYFACRVLPKLHLSCIIPFADQPVVNYLLYRDTSCRWWPNLLAINSEELLLFSPCVDLVIFAETSIPVSISIFTEVWISLPGLPRVSFFSQLNLALT